MKVRIHDGGLVIQVANWMSDITPIKNSQMSLHIHNSSSLYTSVKTDFVTKINLDLKHTLALPPRPNGIQQTGVVSCASAL